MKIWFNKVNESRRSVVELEANEFHIGREETNSVVLRSPLVSRRHAVVRVDNGEMELENVGLNSCLVGDTEVLGGERAKFTAGVKVRIWPNCGQRRNPRIARILTASRGIVKRCRQ